MTIRMLNSSEKRVVFEVLNSDSGRKEIIIVNLDIDLLTFRVKKELVVDLLTYYSESGEETNWKELDTQISEIMQSAISII